MMRVRGPRGLAAWIVVVAAASAAGCEKSRTLACSYSIEDWCASGNACVRTWEEALAEPAFCGGRDASPPLRADCGDYHALTVTALDLSRTYYYDATTGMLTAIVSASGFYNTRSCDAGPTTGFTWPTCAGASEPLAICVDGGAAAAAGRDGAPD
jgi:hypothetical protein